jgi:hypothetical protein
MADHFYSVTLPASGAIGTNTVTKGTVTAAGNFELRVTDAVTGLTGNKVELLKGLEAIKAFIETDSAPA